MQKRPPMGGSRGSDHGGDAATGCRIGPASVTPSDQTAQVSRVKANSARRSTWRDAYAVHPAADVFPMMSDEDLAALGEDIKANGQTIPILFWTDGDNRVLIDGRNRLEAMERIGIADDALVETFHCKDPVTHIITLNIRRRHLTPQQQAALRPAVRARRRAVGGRAPGRQQTGTRWPGFQRWSRQDQPSEGRSDGGRQGGWSRPQRAYRQARHRQGRRQDSGTPTEAVRGQTITQASVRKAGRRP